MQWLAALCVKRPIFASVLILVLCVIGLAGYAQLGVDRFPNIDFPVVVVTTTQPGAAPEDIETEITDKVEEAVNTISGIDELRSITTEGASQVVVTFVIEKDVNIAAQEVRDRINTVIPQLPKDIDLPIVQKLDPDAAPILYYALRSDNHSVRETTELADKRVRRSLESIDGVGQVQLLGGRKRQINVMLDPIKLRGAGVTVLDVQRAIAAQNLTMPGGRVETGPGELTVRIHGRVTDPNQIADLVIRRAEQHSITVRDVGEVQDSEEEADSAAILNGTPTVLLALRKQSGANTVQVADAVKQRIEDIKKALPAGYTLTSVRDESGVIRTSVDAVREHLIVGALLAAVVVFLFLGNFRSTIIAAIAIPTSIIGTFATMWWAGYTLNTITLLALALAVGIVIDDAIVVLENIFRHIEEKGETPMKAAVSATKEIGLAVMATTLSLIAVFLPVAFMGGIPGKFLRSFGVTMAFAIAVSMLVSFSLTPMMSSRWLKEHEANYKTLGQRVVDAFYRPIERAYGRILAFLMNRRWIVVVAGLATLGSCAPLAMKANKGFLPVNDEARFQVTVRTPEGTSLEETRIATERLARDVRDNPNVKLTVTTVGDDAAHTHNLATIYILLTPPEGRTITQNQMMDWTRKNVVAKQPKNYRINVGEVPMFGGGGFSTARVQYTVRGPDLKKLEEVATDVVNKMKQVPGAVDVDSSLIVGKPEIGVFIDRQRAADLGVQPMDIANALRLLVEGEQVSNYEEHGEQYEVHVRAARQYRADEEGLRLLTVPSSRLGQVPLADVVHLGHGTGPARIDRLNRERQVTLLANAAPGYGDGQMAQEMQKILDKEHMSAGYVAAATGQTREMGRVFKAFLLSLVLSFVFMYLVLAAQFESWLHPITILLSLPLTLPFAFISIILFRQAIDIYSVLGILVLFGVVKKNAILQIDHTNQLRAAGMERLPAILQANRDRLRPILMTTAAFVAGMIPLVLSRGVGAGFNRATAGVVVGGQVLSLFLTLVATPVAYSLLDDLSQAVRRLFRMKPAEPEVLPAVEGEAARAAE
ncbi:MAG TPA: efflux RND transporter permease subunit [Polyangiaceae bacterium]|nr:efflux RND transporter permease subunit [Polyangiaceae bacterium]